MSVRHKKLVTLAVGVALFLVSGLAIFFSSNESVSKDDGASAKQNNINKPAEDDLSSEGAMSLEEDKSSLDQAERLSEEEKKETKKTAEEFVKRYAAFNAENPIDNIENAKDYMTEELYNALKKHPTRGTLTHYKVKPEKIYITDVSNDNKDLVRWNVVMQGKVFDKEGKSKSEEDWYLVTIKDVSGEKKVSDVSVNLPS
ncbi:MULTISPECIES: hypothetical protein [Bacillus subtilis group]|uniref:hypothetical protein n=1 Tax=Bacillus subtilis group TaxID=653685 RepID=UPI000EFD0C98|nr:MULTISPECIES: hypothetical protein [Bacillus subtilis group]MCT6515541.1 hypothetical protein [Bacillus subtilis]MCV4329339.1 hypothetical protein [Bacillus velezensis]MDQ8094852.1 hypothetical protein [Bacillus amyloliquefaciens]MEC0383795.1 hypothetical protein [Bacillus velezensis]MEC0389183.1 hypothetical protein [Bacillus velezensis]